MVLLPLGLTSPRASLKLFCDQHYPEQPPMVKFISRVDMTCVKCVAALRALAMVTSCLSDGGPPAARFCLDSNARRARVQPKGWHRGGAPVPRAGSVEARLHDGDHPLGAETRDDNGWEPRAATAPRGLHLLGGERAAGIRWVVC